jgi:NAD(P)-dependent dehydrogenase (short-subunit alcohol dehydrogenase family)
MKGLRVVLTGASAGIGRATAVEFARLGARVALLARGHDGLEGAKHDVEGAGGTALPIATDVADENAVEAAAARVEREWGGIDVWVNDAMATIFSPFEKIAPEDFRRVTEVTYLGAVWGTRAALKRMLPVDRGTIVQVGSALAYRSIPLQSAYCGAKSALRGFTDSLRSELSHMESRVRLSFVILGAFNTPQFDWARTTMPRQPRPVGKVFQPEVAARRIVRAALQPKREVYVGYPALEAVLGNMFIPGLLDRYLARKAWQGQLGRAPLPPGRPDNLYEPVGGDFGAHGRFDAEAHATSWQVRLARHARFMSFLAVTAIMAAACTRLSRSSRSIPFRRSGAAR